MYAFSCLSSICFNSIIYKNGDNIVNIFFLELKSYICYFLTSTTTDNGQAGENNKTESDESNDLLKVLFTTLNLTGSGNKKNDTLMN